MDLFEYQGKQYFARFGIPTSPGGVADTVDEAVEALRAEPFSMLAPTLPNGSAAALHLSISDATGDSAIFEYVGGKLVIHHSRRYNVMTNSPVTVRKMALY